MPAPEPAGGSSTDSAASLTAWSVLADAVTFVLELLALAGFALAGWAAPGPIWLRVLFAVAVPVLVAVAWGRYLSPRASRPLRGRLVVRALVLLAGAAGFLFAGRAVLTLVLALAIAAVTVVAHRGSPGSAAAPDGRDPAG